MNKPKTKVAAIIKTTKELLKKQKELQKTLVKIKPSGGGGVQACCYGRGIMPVK